VQNHFNLVHRDDDALIDELAGSGIAYVPFFPLGGFTPLQSSTLLEVAAQLGATPMQVALAWLMHRSPNILLIPGTSSLDHLREKPCRSRTRPVGRGACPAGHDRRKRRRSSPITSRATHGGLMAQIDPDVRHRSDDQAPPATEVPIDAPA
jgi:Aldo/keto reductase family